MASVWCVITCSRNCNSVLFVGLCLHIFVLFASIGVKKKKKKERSVLEGHFHFCASLACSSPSSSIPCSLLECLSRKEEKYNTLN